MLEITTQQKIKIREASKQDIPVILNFIKELADYEKALNEVIATEEILREIDEDSD